MRDLGVRIECRFPPKMAALARAEEVECEEIAEGELCEIRIFGAGVESLREPVRALYCGNSGTTARLLTGILAGCPFEVTLTGDESLSKRPFKRVIDPLSEMGANFITDRMPLRMRGGSLRAIDYISPRSSAQVKSAILLAGLSARGASSVQEPHKSRDHTERFLRSLGCVIREESLGNGAHKVVLESRPAKLAPFDLRVPGDFSSAAFFLTIGAAIPGSRIVIKDVGFNPTRTGLYSILLRMGANIQISNSREASGEEVVDLTVEGGPLRGVEVGSDDVALAVDEIPVLCVAAAIASGTTEIRGAEELRVKESDRLATMAQVLASFGIKVEEYPDGLSITGGEAIKYTGNCQEPWRRSGDHRIAMCGALFDYLSSGKFGILDKEAVETSFPTFSSLLAELSGSL